MLRLWLRIFLGVVFALVIQYVSATVILGESDLDSYELAGFTISNGFVYHGWINERGGMEDQASLIKVLESLDVPLCDLHVVDSLPHPPEAATDIPLQEGDDFDWEALCQEHDLLRLVIPEQPDLPPAYLFFLDQLRPIVAFQTNDGQAWLGIDPVGDEPWTTDWSELLPFFVLNGGIALALAWFVTNSLVRRIKRLSLLSEEYAGGNLSLRSGDNGKDSIGILGANINSMADSLQRVIEDQRDLLRAVAHELRTPLARIGVATGIVEARHPAVERQMQSIQDDLEELEALIAEITEYLRLEHGKALQRESLNMHRLSSEIIHYELEPFPHIDASITAVPDEESVLFFGHRNSIQRCLGNVVRNAARYAKGEINVAVEKRHGELVILVEDDGPGFPENMLHELSTAFVSTVEGRLGLGLALCQRIVELSGGKMKLSFAAALGGAAVQIHLPCTD